jgi:hypothetical protein
MESLNWKQINKMDKMNLLAALIQYYCFEIEISVFYLIPILVESMSSNQLKSDLWYIVKQSQ